MGRCGRHIIFHDHFHRLWNRYIDGLFHDALGDVLLQACSRAKQRARWCEPTMPESSTSLQRRPANRASARCLCSRLCAAVRACETMVPSCDLCANGKFEKLRLVWSVCVGVVCVVCVVQMIKNTPCLSRVVPTCS